MRFTTFALLASLVCGGAAMVGCDRTVEKSTSKDVKRDGTVVEKEKTVKQDQDGNKTVEEKKTVDKP